MLLSNSITLTPGTVTVRQEGEDYLVLCLNKARRRRHPGLESDLGSCGKWRAGMELIQQCYHYLFWGALVLLGLGLLAVMVYIIRARLTVDRIIGINLTGTLVAIIIAILAYLLDEDYLADMAIVYVVLSFIAVMMLCRIYINLYQRKRQDKKEDESA